MNSWWKTFSKFFRAALTVMLIASFKNCFFFYFINEFSRVCETVNQILMKFDMRELRLIFRSGKETRLHAAVSVHVSVYPIKGFTNFIKIRYVRLLLKFVGQFRV
jgi:hypothetical protein